MEEDREKRFGVIAIEKGYITQEQLSEAMQVQIDEDMEKGEHRLMGKILLELGYITTSQMNEVLVAMDITAEDFAQHL